MNRLEEFIRTRKGQFDEEPEAGHFERFQEKMSTCRDAARHVSIDAVSYAARHVSTRTLRWGLSIAASIAILFTAGVLWQYAGKQNDVMAVCENASDIKICYLEKMNTVAGQIEVLIRDFDPWDQQDVMNDVQYIIDTANSDFENEIPEELPYDVAKAILADYYRQNLEGLEMIVKTITN